MSVRSPEHNAKIRAAHLARGVGASPSKYCPRCKTEKPRSDFGVRPPRKSHGEKLAGYTKSYCIPCDREYANQRSLKYIRANPEARERGRASNRKTILRRKYGLTPEQFKQMEDAQDGRCAGCQSLGSAYGDVTRRLSVDHCHSTGVIRGLLCNICNLSLGKLGDSPATLRRLADYLENHPASFLGRKVPPRTR